MLHLHFGQVAVVLDTVPLVLQETYVLHDGPPYANGDLHIGKLRCPHIKVWHKRQSAVLDHQSSFLQPMVGDRPHPLCSDVQCLAQPPGRDNDLLAHRSCLE